MELHREGFAPAACGGGFFLVVAPLTRSIQPKGLIMSEDHGFFLDENHVIKEIFTFFFGQYLLF